MESAEKPAIQRRSYLEAPGIELLAHPFRPTKTRNREQELNPSSARRAPHHGWLPDRKSKGGVGPDFRKGRQASFKSEAPTTDARALSGTDVPVRSRRGRTFVVAKGNASVHAEDIAMHINDGIDGLLCAGESLET